MSDSLDIKTIKIETEATKKSLENRRDKKPPMCQRISMSVSTLLNYCNRVLFLCNEIERLETNFTHISGLNRVLINNAQKEQDKNTALQTELKEVKRLLQQ